MNDRLRPWLLISRRTISSRPSRLFENRFDRGLRLAGADQISGGAGAEEQADGFDEDGLPGAGLAGEDVEPGFELDLDGLDDRQVADAEETQHAGGTAIVSYV